MSLKWLLSIKEMTFTSTCWVKRLFLHFQHLFLKTRNNRCCDDQNVDITVFLPFQALTHTQWTFGLTNQIFMLKRTITTQKKAFFIVFTLKVTIDAKKRIKSTKEYGINHFVPSDAKRLSRGGGKCNIIPFNMHVKRSN